MGSKFAYRQGRLTSPPSAPLCGVASRFCLPHEITLRLREKAAPWSDGDYEIIDAATGKACFLVHSSPFSVRDKKTLLDAYGQPVLNIKRQLFAVIPNYHVYEADRSERLLFDVRNHVTLIKSRFSVVLDQGVELYMKCNWLLARDAVVTARSEQWGDVPVAEIHRPAVLTMRGLLQNEDYFVSIAPATDIAVIMALCIAYDEYAYGD